MSCLDFESWSPEMKERFIHEMKLEREALKRKLVEIEISNLKQDVENLSVELRYTKDQNVKLQNELDETTEDVIKQRINEVLQENQEEEKELFESKNRSLSKSKPVFYSSYEQNNVEDLEELSSNSVSDSVSKAVDYLIRSKRR